MKPIRHISAVIFTAAMAAGMWLSPVQGDRDAFAAEYEAAVPQSYQDEISDACGVRADSISEADADGVESLSLNIEDGESLEFLEAFHDLETLELTFSTDDDRECLDTVPYLPSLTNLTINAEENLEISFAANNGAFHNNADNIEYLCLSGVDVGPDSVEQLNNLDTLVLEVSLNNEIDYASLDIEELDLSWYGPYDVPVFLTYEEYETLKDNGVKISLCPGISESKYVDVWKEIGQIAGTLGVSEADTEQDITDAVTAYTIDRLEYDGEVSRQIDNNCIDNELVASFYEGGNLYGALARDTAICGNYTALIKALSEYFDVEAFFLINDDHAWNLMLADGELGHVDATYLDLAEPDAADRIRAGEGGQLFWYMEEEESANSIDGRKDPLVFPAYMKEMGAAQAAEEPDPFEEVSPEPEESFESAQDTRSGMLDLLNPLGLFGAAAGLMAGIAAVVCASRRKKPAAEDPMHAVLYWNRLKKKAVLGQKDCLIGSNKAAVNLCIENRFISRRHARISWTQQGYCIQDMGSRNGTFINGRRVTAHVVPLRNGDVIRLGNEQFRFSYN